MPHLKSRRVFAAFLFMTLGVSALHAMTLEAIIAEIKTQPVVDTFDVKVAASVTVQGRTVSLTSHVISKGQDKLWVEQQSPMGSQRIIRNGKKAQSIDLGSGQKQTLSAESVAGMIGIAPKAASLLEDGRLMAPKSIGVNLYQIDMAPGADSSILARSMVYDATQKAIVKITQVGTHQDTTVTEMTQGIVMGKKVLTRVKMDIRMDGITTQMQMDYSDYAFPESILEGLFAIKE